MYTKNHIKMSTASHGHLTYGIIVLYDQASHPFLSNFSWFSWLYFPIFMVFMVIFSLKFMVFMFFWTQFKEILVQIELWRRAASPNLITNLMREKLPAAGENFGKILTRNLCFQSLTRNLCSQSCERKIARRRQKFWENFDQKSLFSCCFLDKFGFSWFFHGFHG